MVGSVGRNTSESEHKEANNNNKITLTAQPQKKVGEKGKK